MTRIRYPIRPAREADIDAIVGLRTEAEQWLRDQEIVQWTDDYHTYARDVLRTSVEAGEAWVVADNGRVIATVSIVDRADPDFWHPADDLRAALYLGKMIVARSHAGCQLGDAIMNWAGLRAAAVGKRWLRIDVRRDNHRLHRYYLDRGWVFVRVAHPPPSRRTESGTLFQRVAGSTTPARVQVQEANVGPLREVAGVTRAGLCGEEAQVTAVTEVAFGPTGLLGRIAKALSGPVGHDPADGIPEPVQIYDGQQAVNSLLDSSVRLIGVTCGDRDRPTHSVVQPVRT